MRNSKMRLVAGLFAGLLLSACGPASEPEAPPGQVSEERVVARWQSMIERDFESVWEYHSPGFRQQTPRADFVREMQRRPFRWIEVEFLGLDCQAEVCEVELRVVYQAVGAPAGMGRMRVPRLVRERWVHLEGSWWYSSN